MVKRGVCFLSENTTNMAVVTLALTETPIVASGLPSEANAAKYQMAEDGVQNETTEDATSSSTMES